MEQQELEKNNRELERFENKLFSIYDLINRIKELEESNITVRLRILSVLNDLASEFAKQVTVTTQQLERNFTEEDHLKYIEEGLKLWKWYSLKWRAKKENVLATEKELSFAVKDLTDHILEYCQEHPGKVRSIRISTKATERLYGITEIILAVQPILDKYEKYGSTSIFAYGVLREQLTILLQPVRESSNN